MKHINTSWWRKMFPYFMIMLWTVFVTVAGAVNNQHIENNSVAIAHNSQVATDNLCAYINERRDINEQEVAKMRSSSDPSVVALGDIIYTSLQQQQIPKDCISQN